MIRRTSIILLSLAAAVHGEAVIRFANGDRFHGQWSAATANHITWSDPAFATPVNFNLDRVLDIQQSPLTNAPKSGYQAKIRLTNGDTVHGQLGEIVKDRVHLITDYAGTLSLHRPMIESVRIQPLAKLLYHGPVSEEDWKFTSNDGTNRTWAFKDGELQATGNGHAYHDFAELPQQFQFSFTVKWKDRLRLRMGICSDDPKTNSTLSCYSLYCEGGRVALQKNNGRGNIQPMGSNITVPAFQQNEKAQCDIFVDRSKGVINLLVDGQSVGLWQDPAPDEIELKRGMRFQSISTAYQVSDIRILEWDGLVQAVPTAEPIGIEDIEEDGDDNKAKSENTSPVEDRRLLLRNGDSITGEVIGITHDVMRIKTPYREIELPVSRLRSVSLPKADYERAKLMNGDVRAHFADGDSITFRLDGLRDGKLLGFSQNFGAATIDPAAFKLIEFNIYDAELEAARKK